MFYVCKPLVLFSKQPSLYRVAVVLRAHTHVNTPTLAPGGLPSCLANPQILPCLELKMQVLPLGHPLTWGPPVPRWRLSAHPHCGLIPSPHVTTSSPHAWAPAHMCTCTQPGPLPRWALTQPSSRGLASSREPPVRTVEAGAPFRPPPHSSSWPLRMGVHLTSVGAPRVTLCAGCWDILTHKTSSALKDPQGGTRCVW